MIYRWLVDYTNTSDWTAHASYADSNMLLIKKNIPNMYSVYRLKVYINSKRIFISIQYHQPDRIYVVKYLYKRYISDIQDSSQEISIMKSILDLFNNLIII